MTTFYDIVEACYEEGITVADLDEILVSDKRYATFDEDIEPAPVVRETDGDEKVVYTDAAGQTCEILLD